jgi:hypothetical protein
MAVASPSWNLSRYVRTSLICNDIRVTEDTAMVERIKEIARNLVGNDHSEIAGYDVATVRTILLDEEVTSPYPSEPPQKYVGK